MQKHRQNSLLFFGLSMLIGFGSTSCSDNLNNANQEAAEFLSALPNDVNYPTSNEYSKEKEELGKMLYWDPILSGNKDVACVSCHHPEHGYADGLGLSQGVGAKGLGPERANGTKVRRNAPTVINTAFNGIDNDGNYSPEAAPMFWDNRVASLEEQALLPMLSKEEMRGQHISENGIVDTIIKRLSSVPHYVELFNKAFGNADITKDRILAAIATFERGIVVNNSRFDQYMRGDLNAMNDFEIQGMLSFLEAGCADCHSGPMLSDYELHTIGVMDNVSPPDDGATGAYDFRTPTLRNLNVTGPYMHNGLYSTLEEVMEFYESVADGDQDERNAHVGFNDLSDEMQDLDLDDDQIEEIIAFLNTLNDDNFNKSIPAKVPSGLPVGGNID